MHFCILHLGKPCDGALLTTLSYSLDRMRLVPLIAALLLPAGLTPGATLDHSALRICQRPNELSRSIMENDLLRDAKDGRLDECSLLEAALVAGGSCDDTEARELSVGFRDWARRTATLTFVEHDAAGSEKAQAQEIFEKLHNELLHGEYVANCSDPAVTLRSGDFNCVTATILYIEALRIAEIPAQSHAMVGHVFCRIGEGLDDVETTCPRWFRLSRHEADEAAARVSRSRARARRNSRRLSDVELIAKIYYNRGVASFRCEDFEQGMLLTKRSLMLDSHDEVARGNVLAGLNNWGLFLCRQEEFAEASQKFAELRKLDPEYATLAENEAHLYQLWEKQRSQQLQAGASEDRTPPGRGT